ILVLDSKKKITTCTKEAASLLDFGAEPASQSFDSLPASLRKLVRQTLSTAKSLSNQTFEFTDSGGSKRAVRLTSTPLISGRKNSGAVLVLRDLSWAKEFEEKITRLDRLASVGTLSASMTHE